MNCIKGLKTLMNIQNTYILKRVSTSMLYWINSITVYLFLDALFLYWKMIHTKFKVFGMRFWSTNLFLGALRSHLITTRVQFIRPMKTRLTTNKAFLWTLRKWNVTHGYTIRQLSRARSSQRYSKVKTSSMNKIK